MQMQKLPTFFFSAKVQCISIYAIFNDQSLLTVLPYNTESPVFKAWSEIAFCGVCGVWSESTLFANDSFVEH